MNKLIQRKPHSRLGLNGPEEVKDHVWFKDYDWDLLYSKKVPSPFLPPQAEDNFDAKYTNSEWKDANSEAMLQHQQQLKRPSVQKLFSGYYHDETMAACAAKEGPQSFTQEKAEPASSSAFSNGAKTASHSFGGGVGAGGSVNPALSDKSSSNKRASAY